MPVVQLAISGQNNFVSDSAQKAERLSSGSRLHKDSKLLELLFIYIIFFLLEKAHFSMT